MIEICAGVLHVSICTSMRYLNFSLWLFVWHSHLQLCAAFCVIVVSLFFFVIVSSLLLNSFPSFIIFRFCSLLRVDLSSCYLFYPLFYFSNVEYSYAPERNSRSPLFLFLLLLLFVLLCKFTFYAMALFCRV